MVVKKWEFMPYLMSFVDKLTIKLVFNFVNMQEWEPLSLQQRQSASIVEVFRIIEEVKIEEKIINYIAAFSRSYLCQRFGW